MIIDRFKIFFRIIFAVVILLASQSHAQNAATTVRSGSAGDVQLTTNYLEKGISQSSNEVSVGGHYSYWFGSNARLGGDFATVSFPNENVKFEARLYGEYTFVFTPNADLRIRNDWVQYFTDGNRNKSILTLDQSFFGYHVLFSREDNFEGTKAGRDWYAFSKDWNYRPDLFFTTAIGYSMIKSSSYNNYFNALGGVTYILNKTIQLMAFGSYATNSSQFNGLAETTLFATARAQF